MTAGCRYGLNIIEQFIEDLSKWSCNLCEIARCTGFGYSIESIVKVNCIPYKVWEPWRQIGWKRREVAFDYWYWVLSESLHRYEAVLNEAGGGTRDWGNIIKIE